VHTNFSFVIPLAVCGSLVVAAAGLAAAPDRGAGVDPAVVEKFRGRNGAVFTDWDKPAAVVVVTGELDGYIEPCGCTGKENQKGGLSRRRNFLQAIKAAGWPLVAVDVGGQVRRFGRQSEAKFQSIADGLRAMEYAAVGFGAGDRRGRRGRRADAVRDGERRVVRHRCRHHAAVSGRGGRRDADRHHQRDRRQVGRPDSK
jgi:hypothetical protein